MCGRKNSKDIPPNSLPLAIQSNTYVGTAVKVLCSCNSVDLKIDYLGLSEWAQCNNMSP